MDQEQYDRLKEFVRLFDEEVIEFTDSMKLEFAEALVEFMTPYEYHEEIQEIDEFNCLYDDMYRRKHVDIMKMWLYKEGYDTVEEYVSYNDLPLPSVYDMVDTIVGVTDEEEYINENCQYVLKRLPDMCVNFLFDETICDRFEEFVVNPEESEDDE